jgi:hypothetical protein
MTAWDLWKKQPEFLLMTALATKAGYLPRVSKNYFA